MNALPSSPEHNGAQPSARRRRFWASVLLALTLLAFMLRAYRLDFQDIWWDEARNVDVATNPFTQIATAPELDIHPPVYFYLLHGWLTLAGPRPGQLLGESAFAARFMSLWFGVLLVPLMYALGHRLGGRWVGLGAATGAAFLPFLLGEAQEARMYTATLIWLACAGLAVLRAVGGSQEQGPRGQESEDRGQRRSWSRGFSRLRARRERPAETPIPEQGTPPHNEQLLPWFLFALFSALALLTHYAAVFALVALWGWAGLRALFGGWAGLWRRLRVVVLAGVVMALFCLPGLPVALRQIPSYRNPNLVVPSIGTYLAELARVYGLGEHLNAAAARPWALALAALLVGGWLLWLANRRVSESANQRIGESANHAVRSTQYAVHSLRSTIRNSQFAILWAFLPLIIYYLVIHNRATFATRYISLALPGWLLLAGYALRGWASVRRWVGALAGVALVTILAPGLRGDLMDARFFREDTRGMVAWLMEQSDPQHDLILVDQRYPFGFYYPRWNNDFDGFPPASPASLTPAQYLFVDINTVADRLTALARDGRSRVYWVRWFESDTDPRGAVPFLLQKFGVLRGEHNFRGYNVSWYDIAPGATFELAPPLNAFSASFGDQVALTGAAFGGRGYGPTADVAATRLPTAPADQTVWAAAQWARLADARQPLKVTLVLEDSAGMIVGRDDRPLVNDRHLAPDQWPETDHPFGAYLLRAAPATPPGTYTLKLAVYEPTSLAQLPASGRDANGGFAILGQVVLTRADTPVAPEQLSVEIALDLTWQGVRLLGRGPLPAELDPGDQLGFDLFWQSQGDGLGDLRVRLTLVGDEGAAEGGQFQHDGQPVAGYPVSQWARGEVLRGRQRWQTDPNLSTGNYRLELRLVAADGSTSPPINMGQITVTGRPHRFEPPSQMDGRMGARIGDFAQVLGYRLEPEGAPSPGSALVLTLFWRATGASALPYTVSVQLLDATGTLRAQRDQQPADGAAPTTGWVKGEIIADTYRLDLPADLMAGAYQLVVRVYDPVTMATLPVSAEDGAALGDTLPLTPVEIRGK